jgi:Carboxypeptidase regulatory-like domain
MRKRILILATLIVLLMAVPARAQDAPGTLVGCVTDVIDAPLPHATIELSASRAMYVTVFGDDQGCYEVAMPPGEYVLVAKLSGFASITRDELQVVPGGRLRVDLKMRLAPICECLMVKPPTVESLWASADVVAWVRITGHDRQFEFDRDPLVVQTATVLDLWKATDKAGQTGGTLQFNQRPGGPRYAVGDEFVLFLTARSALEVAGAFEIVDGRVHDQQFPVGVELFAPVTGFLGKPLDELVSQIVALVRR